MFILMRTRSSANMIQVNLKSRSLGQILETPYLRCRGHIFDPIFLKLGEDVNLKNIQVKFEYGSGRVKMQVTGSNLRKTLFKLLRATFLAKFSSNLVRMVILMISWSSLSMDQIRSKCRSLGQFLGKLCIRLRGHFFGPIFLNLVRIFILMISGLSSNMSQVMTKSRSIGQM